MADNSSSSVASVAIVLLVVVAAGAFYYFVLRDRQVAAPTAEPTKVEVNMPKPADVAPKS